jgi:hypothetical protein
MGYLKYLQPGILEPKSQSPRAGRTFCGPDENAKCYCEDEEDSGCEKSNYPNMCINRLAYAI